MNENLKPCPFCGGKAKFVHIFENPERCMVSCRECDGGIDAVFANEEAAAEAWNRCAASSNDALTLDELKVENAQLRAVITESDPDFFKRKCRICGCDWNHPCNDHDYWVSDDLCSACACKPEGGET